MKSAMEVVQGFYSAFDNGEIEKAFSFFSEDIEWRLVGPSTIPYFGTYSGIDEVKEFFATLAEHEQINEFQPLEFLEGVHTVTVLGKESCSSKASGKSFKTEWAHIFSVNEGKITRFLEYIDTVPMDAAYK